MGRFSLLVNRHGKKYVIEKKEVVFCMGSFLSFRAKNKNPGKRNKEEKRRGKVSVWVSVEFEFWSKPKPKSFGETETETMVSLDHYSFMLLCSSCLLPR